MPRLDGRSSNGGLTLITLLFIVLVVLAVLEYRGTIDIMPFFGR